VLESRVLDSSGSPVTGAKIVIFESLHPAEMAEGEKGWAWSGCYLGPFPEQLPVLAPTYSGPDGSYRFEGLKVGAYTVRVTASGLSYAEKEILVGFRE
jgi:protocatechuate 3,4-dioxygenase beta subunit